MEEDLEQRIEYTQPHNIKVPTFLYGVQIDQHRQYEHNRLKHEALDLKKYMRSKWHKRKP